MVINLKKDVNKKYVKISKKNAILAVEILNKEYSDARCGLNFNSSLELTIALILAAQCTDERVNKIIPILFNKYSNVYELANANISDIQEIIKPCGFYFNKSKSIIETSNLIVEKFNGKVPDNMKDLTSLKGIGRKSANIILQECFNNTVGIAVDTHVTRISRKIGLSNSNTPEKIEQDLIAIFDKKYWNRINHIFVCHGRAICIARRPKCNICPINHICSKNE